MKIEPRPFCEEEVRIRWLDGYDHIKGTTSKEIQTVMGELFSKASALKDAVEGGAESLARIEEVLSNES